MTDDQGFGDIGIHGNDRIRTPNMDRDRARGRPVHAVPGLPGLLSDAVEPDDRAVQLPDGRGRHVPGAVHDASGRGHAWPSCFAARATGRASSASGTWATTTRCGRWTRAFRNVRRDPGRRASASPRTCLAEATTSTRSCSGTARPSGSRDIAPTSTRKRRSRSSTRTPNRPFFLYLATNAPHDPLQVADDLVAPYRRLGLDEETAKTYAMVENADTNIGRVLSALERRGLEKNTIVIFLTDNGPQRARYNAGMRGVKGSVYQGGIRVPFFLRWPSVVDAGSKVDRIAAHIDVMPTLLEACGVACGEASRGRTQPDAAAAKSGRAVGRPRVVHPVASRRRPGAVPQCGGAHAAVETGGRQGAVRPLGGSGGEDGRCRVAAGRRGASARASTNAGFRMCRRADTSRRGSRSGRATRIRSRSRGRTGAARTRHGRRRQSGIGKCPSPRRRLTR